MGLKQAGGLGLGSTPLRRYTVTISFRSYMLHTVTVSLQSYMPHTVTVSLRLHRRSHRHGLTPAEQAPSPSLRTFSLSQRLPRMAIFAGAPSELDQGRISSFYFIMVVTFIHGRGLPPPQTPNAALL